MNRFSQKLSKVFIFSLYIGVLASCSKNLSKTSSAKNENFTKNVAVDSFMLQPSPIAVSAAIVIDTLSYQFDNRGSSFINTPYYSQKVTEKRNLFYRSKDFRTQWLFDKAPSSLYYTVVNVLENAFQYGLIPDDYDVKHIQERLNGLYRNDAASPMDVVSLDIHITEMYFLFTTHLLEGKVRNVGTGRNVWKRPTKAYSPIDVIMLLQAETSDALLSCIDKLQPQDGQYIKLKKALDHYRLLETSAPENFPIITVSGKIKPDERNDAIPLIRKKLSLTDLRVYPMVFDSITGSMDSMRYDQTLVDAIKFFQLRHGLETDGIIGEKTLKFLNQSFREKADVIALNMERLRWLPESYGENYITVNVPEYKLRVYEGQKQELEMDVIVGASNKATPIFTDELEYIVFSPTWTVPVSIIKEEIIPRLQENPEYYSNKNYSFFKNEVAIDPAQESWNSDTVNPYQYRIVQNPGPDNSLGLVKFVMPNTMNVYLHDTPNHRLFSKDYRALSHGCVRLDEPARFAEYLLRDQKGWTSDRISKAMSDSTPYTIHLKKHYGVHMEYRTAWVDENGQVNFREDIYGHDRMQLTQLRPVDNTSSTFFGM